VAGCHERRAYKGRMSLVTKKAMHTKDVPCGGILLFTSGQEVAPSQAMELQEIGVDGQGSREPRGSDDDRIFFMKDNLADMVSIMVNKFAYKPSKGIMDKYYEMFTVARMKQTKKTLSTVPTAPNPCTRTRTQMGELDLGEVGGLSQEDSVVCEGETGLSFIKITQSLIY
jgi:hypothetical protein